MEVTRVKYPRTSHLPWSLAVQSDDVKLADATQFEGHEVVITEKLDGENTTMYNDGIHARSIDGRHHPSQDWVKSIHAHIAPLIPDGWRVCGENVFAQHSVAYDNLSTYFYVFSIWDHDTALSWDDTVEWSELFGLETVPVLYRGPWNEKLVRDIAVDTDKQEGYVVRLADSFTRQDFTKSLAKWVRKGHVQTNNHWMHQQIVPNKLKR